MAVSWYVMTIRPMMSSIAEAALLRQGFSCLFPKIKVENRSTELFPGYGLVEFDRLDPDCNWEDIRSTRGVRGLLPLGHEKPLSIPEDFVRHVMQHLEDLEAPAVAVEHSYARGDVVEILSGPLAGFGGEYLARRNKGLAEVEVALFGNVIKASVKTHQMRPARQDALAA